VRLSTFGSVTLNKCLKAFYNVTFFCNGRGLCFGRREWGSRPGEKSTRAGSACCMYVTKSFVLIVHFY